jgi:hypothetical protein
MNTDWMKSQVTHLIHITHSQWILWNFTLHNKQRGYLRLQQCRDLLREVDSLLDTPPEEVLEESRYLLELDFLTLYNATFEQQSYWVLAMKAMRRAGQQRAQIVKHQRGSKKCCNAAQGNPSRLKYNSTHDERQTRHELGLDLPLDGNRVQSPMELRIPPTSACESRTDILLQFLY